MTLVSWLIDVLFDACVYACVVHVCLEFNVLFVCLVYDLLFDVVCLFVIDACV